MLVNTSIQSINAPLQAVPLLLVSRIRGNPVEDDSDLIDLFLSSHYHSSSRTAGRDLFLDLYLNTKTQDPSLRFGMTWSDFASG